MAVMDTLHFLQQRHVNVGFAQQFPHSMQHEIAVVAAEPFVDVPGKDAELRIAGHSSGDLRGRKMPGFAATNRLTMFFRK